MTEITRNDLTALRYMGIIVDRLKADREAYEQKRHENLAVYSQLLNLAQAQTRGPNAVGQVVSTGGVHAHSIGGLFHQINYPDWEPRLTQAEFDTLMAWADGEDILVHILSAER